MFQRMGAVARHWRCHSVGSCGVPHPKPLTSWPSMRARRGHGPCRTGRSSSPRTTCVYTRLSPCPACPSITQVLHATNACSKYAENEGLFRSLVLFKQPVCSTFLTWCYRGSRVHSRYSSLHEYSSLFTFPHGLHSQYILRNEKYLSVALHSTTHLVPPKCIHPLVVIFLLAVLQQ